MNARLVQENVSMFAAMHAREHVPKHAQMAVVLVVLSAVLVVAKLNAILVA